MTSKPSVAAFDSDGLLDALDMPAGVYDVQRAYWLARAEWVALDAAYKLVVADALKRLEHERV